MKITSRNNTYPGVFIAVEGIDGCGKTTAVEKLKTLIETLLPSRELVTFRAPGATAMGEKVRNILLNEPMTSISELLLFMASHSETIDSVIVPALKRGTIVLTDRFLDSTYAYQGYGRGLLNEVQTIHREILYGFEPDHVIYINAEQQIANNRLVSRGDMNRLDILETQIKNRIHLGMRSRQEHRLRNESDRVTILENNHSVVELSEKCRQFVEKNLI